MFWSTAYNFNLIYKFYLRYGLTASVKSTTLQYHEVTMLLCKTIWLRIAVISEAIKFHVTSEVIMHIHVFNQGKKNGGRAAGICCQRGKNVYRVHGRGADQRKITHWFAIWNKHAIWQTKWSQTQTSKSFEINTHTCSIKHGFINMV